VVNILLSCFPKSGSSHVADVLSRVTGFPKIGAVQFYGQNEQDLYEPALRVLATTSSVTQQHVKGTNVNVDLMQRYGIRPVILVRNVFDALVSLHDHFERENFDTPVGFVHREYRTMSFEDRLRFLVHLHLPWYLHFVMSWREAAERLQVLWTSYEEVFADQEAGVRRILDFYGLDATQEDIRRAISAAGRGPRFNVGLTGRGQRLMPPDAQQAARQIAGSWSVDDALLQRIGLGNASKVLVLPTSEPQAAYE